MKEVKRNFMANFHFFWECVVEPIGKSFPFLFLRSKGTENLLIRETTCLQGCFFPLFPFRPSKIAGNWHARKRKWENGFCKNWSWEERPFILGFERCSRCSLPQNNTCLWQLLGRKFPSLLLHYKIWPQDVWEAAAAQKGTSVPRKEFIRAKF